MDFGVDQELLRVAELFHTPADRGEQPADRFQDGRIIVEQADNIGNRVSQSKPRLHVTLAERILDLSLMWFCRS